MRSDYKTSENTTPEDVAVSVDRAHDLRDAIPSDEGDAGQGVDALPPASFSWHIARLCDSNTAFGRRFRATFGRLPVSRCRRVRDIFPLPPTSIAVDACLTAVVNGALAGLNFLNGGFKFKPPASEDVNSSLSSSPDGAHSTAAQRKVHAHVIDCCRQQLDRLAHTGDNTFSDVMGALARFEPENSEAPPSLVAEHVGLPKEASTCVASKYLSADLRRMCNTPGAIMPIMSPDNKLPTVNEKDREEYLALIGRELRVHKVHLLLYPKHVAGRFVVGKRGTDRLRPIWNGSSLSVASADPPAPRRLANPASLPHIRVKPGERLYFSKRDAASFFDALEAPSTQSLVRLSRRQGGTPCARIGRRTRRPFGLRGRSAREPHQWRYHLVSLHHVLANGFCVVFCCCSRRQPSRAD